MCGSQVCPQWLWVTHINILTVVFISRLVQERVTLQRQTALRETPRGTQMGSEGEQWNWCITETCVWNIKCLFRAWLEHLRQSQCSLSEELIINKITVGTRERNWGSSQSVAISLACTREMHKVQFPESEPIHPLWIDLDWTAYHLYTIAKIWVGLCGTVERKTKIAKV